jgi:hypothetical protein
MNKGRQRPFAAIVPMHFDDALAADGYLLLFLNHGVLGSCPTGACGGNPPRN